MVHYSTFRWSVHFDTIAATVILKTTLSLIPSRMPVNVTVYLDSDNPTTLSGVFVLIRFDTNGLRG